MYNERMTQAIFGIYAKHVPAWMYVQKSSEGVLFVGASQSLALTWGSEKTHQFMLGEVIARPHFAIASDVFRGHGIAGLATANHPEFLAAPDLEVLCDPLGQIIDFQRRVENVIRRS